jgi:hypothetical protein
MTEINDQDGETRLIARYFEHWRTKDEELFDAWDEVYEITHYEPERGWALVLKLLEAAPDDRALCYVAAGPLEDLIVIHGERLLPLIVAAIATNARLRDAIPAVWGADRTATEVVEGIRRAMRDAPPS